MDRKFWIESAVNYLVINTDMGVDESHDYVLHLIAQEGISIYKIDPINFIKEDIEYWS